MKNFISLIAIVVAFYSYSSKANEIVGKGLVCVLNNSLVADDALGNNDSGRLRFDAVGVFFVNEREYEIWYNTFTEHYYIKRKDYNTKYRSAEEFKWLRNYNHWKKLRKIEFFKFHQLPDYKLEDLKILLNRFCPLCTIGSPNMSIDRTSLKNYDGYLCEPQKNKTELLKNLQIHNSKFVNLYDKILKENKSKLDKFYKLKEIEHNKKLKKRKF